MQDWFLKTKESWDMFWFRCGERWRSACRAVKRAVSRFFSNRFVIILLVVIALTVAFHFIGVETRKSMIVPEAKGNMVIAVTNMPSTLDPADNTTVQTETIMNHLFANLMHQVPGEDGSITVSNDLAENYAVEDNYDTTTTYTFYLRKDAVWSDGVAIRASDFVYSWRRLLENEESRAVSAYYLNVVQGYQEAIEQNDPELLNIVAVDDYTLSITLTGHCTYFLSETCCASLTAPLREDMKSGWEYDVSKLICSGPYIAKKFALSGEMVLEKNERYHQADQVKMAQILFRYYSSDMDAYNDYYNGTVDFLMTLPNAIIQYVMTHEDEVEEYRVTAMPSVYYVAVNQEVEGFNSEVVREAFSLAVDHAALAEALGGSKLAATGLVPYGVVDDRESSDFRTVGGDYYTLDPEEYKENKLKARELLTSAGYANRSDFPRVEYVYRNTSENNMVAQRLQTMWENVLGITVHLIPCSESEYETRMASGTFSLLGAELSSSVNDPLMFLEPWTTESETNFIHYSTHVFDILISASKNFSMEGAHCLYLHEAENMILTQNALIPLYYNTSSSALRSGISGVYRDNDGHYFFHKASEVISQTNNG